MESEVKESNSEKPECEKNDAEKEAESKRETETDTVMDIAGSNETSTNEIVHESEAENIEESQTECPAVEEKTDKENVSESTYWISSYQIRFLGPLKYPFYLISTFCNL